MIDPAGVYDVAGLPVHIVPRGNEWIVELAGVPKGFEPGLVRVGDASFRIERGPFHGAELTVEDGGGSLGPMPITRLDGPYVEPVGYGLLAPETPEDPERDDAFAQLFVRATPGQQLEWDLPYPKHQFVQWVMSLDAFIFHGSNETDLEIFHPVRTSVELRDHGERGNLGAVYGTHDGLWALFFAVIDRSRLEGSIRNGVSRWEAPDGRRLDTYQFSIHHASLPGRPFTTGALYVLPRDSFERLPFYPGGPLSDEWASTQPVRPRASVIIEPEDFPFLDRIAAHDDGPLLEMMSLARRLLSKAESMSREEGLTISIPWSHDLDEVYVAWRTALVEFMPGVEVWTEHAGDHRTLHIRGPENYERTIAEFVEGVLTGEEA